MSFFGGGGRCPLALDTRDRPYTTRFLFVGAISLPSGCSPTVACFLDGWIKVNLWAVPRPSTASSNAGMPKAGKSNGRPPGSRQPSPGFEHALGVDLSELVGADGDASSGDGAPKHIALLGNTVAVATDHVLFVLRLRFDVKGGRRDRCGGEAVWA